MMIMMTMMIRLRWSAQSSTPRTTRSFGWSLTLLTGDYHNHHRRHSCDDDHHDFDHIDDDDNVGDVNHDQKKILWYQECHHSDNFCQDRNNDPPIPMPKTMIPRKNMYHDMIMEIKIVITIWCPGTMTFQSRLERDLFWPIQGEMFKKRKTYVWLI